MIYYLLLGEVGYEVAQYNAAFLLDRGTTLNFFFIGFLVFASLTVFPCYFPLRHHNAVFRYFGPVPASTHVFQAISRPGLFEEGFFCCCSFFFSIPHSPLPVTTSQGHAGSRVKVGDYLYYGRGVAADPDAAADEYRAAADANNAQAMFNLGLMHHLGDGLEHDIHLAKRFYDMALRTSAEARLPASLALYCLYGAFLKEWIVLHALPYVSHLVDRAVTDVDVEDLLEVRMWKMWSMGEEAPESGSCAAAQEAMKLYSFLSTPTLPSPVPISPGPRDGGFGSAVVPAGADTAGSLDGSPQTCRECAKAGGAASARRCCRANGAGSSGCC